MEFPASIPGHLLTSLLCANRVEHHLSNQPFSRATSRSSQAVIHAIAVADIAGPFGRALAAAILRVLRAGTETDRLIGGCAEFRF